MECSCLVLGFGMPVPVPSGWRPKKRTELAMLRGPPAPKRKSHKATAKRPREVDDDPWMDDATPTADPTPVPLTSIFKEAPLALPLVAPLLARDALTAKADKEVASLTPSE